MKNLIRLFQVLLVVLVFAAPHLLMADDMSMNDGAYGPEPVGGYRGEESVVRMQSERITVRFGRSRSEVDARFVFRSTKPRTPARQLLGFPDFGAAIEEADRRTKKGEKNLENTGDAWNNSGPIEHMETFVAGKKVESNLKYGFVALDNDVGFLPSNPKDGSLMAWYTVWVTFPPDKDVVVERKYEVPNAGTAWGVNFLNYTTLTGAAWHGTIGGMDVDVTLLDGLTVDDLAWKGDALAGIQRKDGPYSSPRKGQWEIVSPTQLRYHWDEFKPRTDKDKRCFQIALRSNAATETAITSVNDGASGPEPIGGGHKNQKSVIRLASQSLKVEFGRKESKVVSTSVFQSTKQGSEAKQLVGFANLFAANQEGDRLDRTGMSGFPEYVTSGPVEDLGTRVDGNETKLEVKVDRGSYMLNSGFQSDPKAELHAWDATWVIFPAGREVTVEKAYRVPNAVRDEKAGRSTGFTYSLWNSDIWNGTIGKFDVDVTLTDGLTVDDLCWNVKEEESELTPAKVSFPKKDGWEIVSPTHLRFSRENLDPDMKRDEVWFSVVTLPR
jgi:hypothetical protein